MKIKVGHLKSEEEGNRLSVRPPSNECFFHSRDNSICRARENNIHAIYGSLHLALIFLVLSFFRCQQK